MTGFIRVDFAGGGGTCEGLRMLGLPSNAVEYMAPMVATLRANGHKAWQVDVTSDECRGAPWPPIWGYCASPECQSFSMAGNGEGRAHLDKLAEAAHKVADGATPEDAVAAVSDTALKKSSMLSLEPMLVIARHRPTWVVLEQVPGVLPLWEVYAEIMPRWGYSVKTAILHAEQFGVPQTRKRAFLVAHLEREAVLPTPTHSKYHSHNPAKLDDGVLPWISMAEALGRWIPPTPNGGDASWVERRPSPTIVGSYRPDIVAVPKYRKAGDGPRQSQPGSVSVSVSEAAILQSFPVGYEFVGNQGKQYLQVGNAVPVLLQAAVVGALLGVDAVAQPS